MSQMKTATAAPTCTPINEGPLTETNGSFTSVTASHLGETAFCLSKEHLYFVVKSDELRERTCCGNDDYICAIFRKFDRKPHRGKGRMQIAFIYYRHAKHHLCWDTELWTSDKHIYLSLISVPISVGGDKMYCIFQHLILTIHEDKGFLIQLFLNLGSTAFKEYLLFGTSFPTLTCLNKDPWLFFAISTWWDVVTEHKLQATSGFGLCICSPLYCMIEFYSVHIQSIMTYYSFNTKKLTVQMTKNTDEKLVDWGWLNSPTSSHSVCLIMNMCWYLEGCQLCMGKKKHWRCLIGRTCYVVYGQCVLARPAAVWI